MEPITIFALAVSCIASCHIVFSAVNRFGKGVYHKGSRPAKRDDWYCFFKTADLLIGQTEQRTTTFDRQQLERRRQQQRYRSRVN